MTDIKTAQQLLVALPTPVLHIGGDLQASSLPLSTLCCDSRHAAPNSLFVCIRGAYSDGHDYIRAAYEAGCRCFLVEHRTHDPLPSDACVFLSDDTRRDLAFLSAAYYDHPAKKMKLVGITGTKGKTSVALMCHHIFRSAGLSSGYIGTCGVRYGDICHPTANTTPGPLELQQYLSEMQAAGVQTVFVEVSSQALWQHRVTGLSFDAVALTNLSPDHIGGAEHPDFDHYAACKRRLLTDFGAKTILVNRDDIHTESLLLGMDKPVVGCGIHTACDAQAKYVCSQQQELPGIAFTYCAGEEEMPVFLALPGEHNVYNALFAITLTRALGISPRTAAEALSHVSLPGRFEMLSVRQALVVIDYAHNAASLRAALTTLRGYAPRRLLCLFGSVGDRTQCRRAELGSVANELADFSYLTADNPGFEDVESICREIARSFDESSRYCIIPDRAGAIRTAIEALCPGDVLLLAGKGDEQFQTVCGRQEPHSDREAVQAVLDELSLRI